MRKGFKFFAIHGIRMDISEALLTELKEEYFPRGVDFKEHEALGFLTSRIAKQPKAAILEYGRSLREVFGIEHVADYYILAFGGKVGRMPNEYVGRLFTEVRKLTGQGLASAFAVCGECLRTEKTDRPLEETAAELAGLINYFRSNATGNDTAAGMLAGTARKSREDRAAVASYFRGFAFCDSEPKDTAILAAGGIFGHQSQETITRRYRDLRINPQRGGALLCAAAEPVTPFTFDQLADAGALIRDKGRLRTNALAAIGLLYEARRRLLESEYWIANKSATTSLPLAS